MSSDARSFEGDWADWGLEIREEPTMQVIVMIDASAAMTGRKIDLLASAVDGGMERLFDSQQDCVYDITIMSYSDDSNVEGRFWRWADYHKIEYKTGGLSFKGNALNHALRVLDSLEMEFKDRRIIYHMPWIIFVSDGASNDSTTEVALQLNKKISENRLGVYAIGYEDCDWSLLEEIAGENFVGRAENFDLCHAIEQCLEEDLKVADLSIR